MFTRILTSALFAGVSAGLIAGFLQLFFVQPVLLHAELYETGVLTHFGTDPVSAMQDVSGIDPVRDGLTLLFTSLVYTGYGLMMVALMAFATERGVQITARQGILWGIAGFIGFHLAPAFGLPPEVPGVAAAEVASRQVWWFSTVAATILALWLISFSESRVSWGLAIVLLLAPHVIGAPEPQNFVGPVPPEIAALFASRALGVGLAAWVVLGFLAGHFWHQEQEHGINPGQA